MRVLLIINEDGLRPAVDFAKKVLAKYPTAVFITTDNTHAEQAIQDSLWHLDARHITFHVPKAISDEGQEKAYMAAVIAAITEGRAEQTAIFGECDVAKRNSEAFSVPVHSFPVPEGE